MSDEENKPMSGIGRSLMDNISDRVGPQAPQAHHITPKVDLKEHVKGDVEFLYYRDGNLWYECLNTSFKFPVPVSDAGNATFQNRDKAMLFMRYIRKHLELKP